MPRTKSSKVVREFESLSGEGLDSAVSQLELARIQKFSEQNLSSVKSRAAICYAHPMLESKYFIDTEEANDFYQIAYDHIFARKSGLYCTGEFRVGKTTAIQNTIERLRREAAWAAVFFHSATRDMHQTKKNFCLDLLKSFRQSAVASNAAISLERFLITQAVNAGSRTCVVFIDEAQMLTVMQLRYLLEIWNSLRAEGFILVTILVGQKDLVSLKNLTSDTDHGAVIARFFVKGFHLGGLHSQDELKLYLKAFDSQLFFPPRSDWSYTKFFRKKSFDAGWGLADECESLWQCLVELAAPNERMLRYSGFRLAFVNDAIHCYLLDSMRVEAEGKKITSLSLWKDAVMSAASNDQLIGDGRV